MSILVLGKNGQVGNALFRLLGESEDIIYTTSKETDSSITLDLTKFGIGGYFMITKTTHQIGPGTGDTSIEETWVASKDGKYGKKDLGPEKEKRGEGEGSEKVSKCLISSRSS